MIAYADLRRLALFCWIFLTPILAAGQDLSFEASVDQTQISLNQHITLTISVSGNDLDDVPEPTLPDLPDFHVIARTSASSSNISIINGKFSSSRTIQYIYRLQPRKTGSLVIDAARITYKGTTSRTAPIIIQVSDGSSRPSPTSPPSFQGGGATGQPTPADQPNLGDELFIRAIVDKNTVYVGEQVTVTYKLFVRDRVGLSNVQYDQLPAFSGFWMEDLFSAQNLDFKLEVINGKRYNTALIKQVALFPTVAGNQNIDPLSILCDVPMPRSRGLFDNFFNDPFDTSLDSFFSRNRRVSIRTAPQTIKVNPLPSEGKPKPFSGGVGKFSIRGSIDKKQAEATQPLTLTIVLSGTGNLKTVSDPVLPDLTGFKQYTSSNEDHITKQNALIGGEKTYTYVLIPLSPGEQEIAPVTFTFFDPTARVYKKVSTDPIPLTVAPGNGDPSALAYITPKAEVKQLKQDIQYIKPESVALFPQGDVLYRSFWYLLLHAIPAAAVIGAILYKSHARRLRQDVGYARRRRAYGEARRELQAAERLLKQGELEQAFTHISNMLHQYIGDKYNTSYGLTSQEASDLLSRQGVNEETLKILRSCLDACDMARFAPTMLTPESTGGVLKAAQQVIAALEQKLVKTL